jgi:FkbM family methyltransferase
VENVTTEPGVLRHIVEAGLLADDPFVLLDVGCALGIDAAWRSFSPHLRAYGFDPQVDECRRLNAAETDPNVSYHAAFVAVPDDHPFRERTASADQGTEDYFNPLPRTSALRALARQPTIAHEAAEAVQATERWRDQQLAVERVTLAEFVERESLRSVDFVKIDTDGADLEAAVSCEPAIRPAGILGFLIESPFSGSHHDGENTFHNIDRYMKSQGFLLFGMTVNRYSRGVLPRTFVYRAPYQTRAGQPLWGDMLYLRDAGSPQYERVWGSPLPIAKLLKLVCLFELFELPDAAAEVVLRHRAQLESAVDTETVLDLLTPPLRGRHLSYREYDAAFEADVQAFYPEPPREPLVDPPTPEDAPRPRDGSLGGRMRRLLRSRGRR